MVKIGSLILKTPYVAGPMVRLSHAALRKIITSFKGAGLLFTEMLDARRLPREEQQLPFFIKKYETEPPLFVQIYASEPKGIEKAILLLRRYDIDGIDINMGCAAPSIKKQNGGIMLMKNDIMACEIVKRIRDVYDGPLSVKVRTGFIDDIEQTVVFMRKLEQAGVDAVFYHPRLFNQKFKSRAKWAYVSELKKHLKIPVIGNGDIRSAREAIDCFEETQCDGIMISRYSAISPWIFEEIACLINGIFFQKPDLGTIWFEFLDELKKYYQEKEVLKRMDLWTLYYSRNFKFGHSFWTSVHNASSLDQVYKAGKSFFKF